MASDNDTILQYSYIKTGIYRYSIVANNQVIAGPFGTRSDAETQLAKLRGDYPDSTIVKKWYKGSLVVDD